ncbi:hypothetical protein Tco_1293236 [Tanacetum coccineum]
MGGDEKTRTMEFRMIQALQDGTTVVIGGKTSRSKIKFPEEMNRVLVHVPEINKPSDVSRASTMVDDIGMDEGIKLTDMLKLLKTLLCSMEAMKSLIISRSLEDLMETAGTYTAGFTCFPNAQSNGFMECKGTAFQMHSQAVLMSQSFSTVCLRTPLFSTMKTATGGAISTDGGAGYASTMQVTEEKAQVLFTMKVDIIYRSPYSFGYS